MKLLYEKAYFDFTEIINLAVQFLEGDEDDDEDAATVRGHVRDDIRYVVVDEYQDVNPLQERLVRGLTQFGANLCVVGDDDQTIYQWRGSEVSNIVTFADRYAGVHQVTLAENFRSSEGVVEVGTSVAERIPAGSRLPKAMVRAGHQSWTRGDLIARDFADEDAEAAWICDRIEAMRGLAFNDTADSRGARPVVVGLRRALPVGREGCRPAGRGDAPARHPVRRQGPESALRQPGDPGRRRGVPLHGRPRRRRPICAVSGRTPNLLPADGDWAAALAVLDEGRDFDRGERWGVYNIQRLYLEFLEALGLREETVPGDPVRRELVFYQLGKFSQAISDFEEIYFNTEPAQKYESFAKWLEYQAPDYYAESDADVGYATPDAVTLTTVHQAKGMQWPAVFIPCLRKNRFPSKRQGGLGLFHVIPEAAIARCRPLPRHGRGRDAAVLRRGHARAEVPVRVVLARRRTSSTGSGRSSSTTARASSGSRPGTRACRRTRRGSSPRPATRRRNVTLSFSELKYLFECPYQFKLRFLYGFNPPLHEALGYGKGLHDALVGGAQARARRRHRRERRGRGSRRPASAHSVRVPRAAGRRCTTRP